jgi:hypothetical protein
VRQPMLVKDEADVTFGEPTICRVVGRVHVHYGFLRRTHLGPFSVILGEDGAETPVDHAKDNCVGHNLREASRTRREREEDARGEEDEEEHGDEDVCVEGGHFV